MGTGKTILVTGASGFIGRRVVKHLVDQKFNVRILLRASSRVHVPGVEISIGNIEDIASLEKATKNIDCVIHLAALKSDEKNSHTTNVIGTSNLVKACQKNGVGHIINISSSSTKIKNKGIYAKTKEASDAIVAQSGIPYTILKPSIVYGDMQNGVFGALAHFAKWPITPVIGNGRCKFWPIHVDDLANIISLSITSADVRNKIYDVGGPDAISINQIVREISEKIFEKRAFIVHIPSSIGLLMAKIFGLILQKPPITESNILGSTQDIEWNKDAIFNELNFTPRKFSIGITEVKSSYAQTEAEILYAYIYSRSGVKFQMTDDMRERYFKALQNNNVAQEISVFLLRFPLLLGPIDAITKIFYKSANIQKRLQIATVLVECDTQSAKWLLPKNRSVTEVVWSIFIILLSSGLKIFLGIFFFLIPGFIKKHAR